MLQFKQMSRHGNHLLELCRLAALTLSGPRVKAMSNQLDNKLGQGIDTT